ncbi:aldo/keto reductase [Croceitalea rosinachiae]|uniref:Aldo/keto reductase n=1 Tax=Croceitalea rosinachiae TaxID=3075596 RepID=A0ABU3AD52_9FLAO|nr:aldo/keto reductase [Croceitalea sp. F388]MDT0607848.1 aldo/keto reductase [Croceitalea sp. F388]
MDRKITDLTGTFKLHNGIEMPYLGLGTYMPKDSQEVTNSVRFALDYGYRHIDTAAIYRNENDVRMGIEASNVPRQEVFLTSKVWNSDHGYDKTLKAFERSLANLKMDYLDLYLVHWPVVGEYKETWRALEELYEQGRVRAIGVCNFLKHQLEDLIEDAKVIPMVNQMEFHPYLVQQELINFCQLHRIQYQAWSPLMQGKVFELPELEKLAEKYNKNIAQIVLRYDLQKGVITIPKSSKEKRIIANANLFDFELSESDMNFLDAMDRNFRTGPNPDNFEWSVVL